MKLEVRSRSYRSMILIALTFALASPALSKAYDPSSPLTQEEQALVQKAVRMAKGGHGDKAKVVFEQALSSCTDLPKCFAVAAAAEGFGYPAQDIKREALEKAVQIGNSREDFLQIAIKARDIQCYEVTSAVVKRLIGQTESAPELYDLAQKANEIALTDVAHMALEKAYGYTKSAADALMFIHTAHNCGARDLERRAMKDLTDDEPNVHNLLVLLTQIQPYQQPDANRYLLKKALNSCIDLSEFKEVYDVSLRYGQKDVAALAQYRGKKMQLLQELKSDQVEYQKQLAAWKAGQIDQAEQKAADDMAKTSTGF